MGCHTHPHHIKTMLIELGTLIISFHLNGRLGALNLNSKNEYAAGVFPKNGIARVRLERVKQTVREFSGNIKTLWPRSGGKRHYNYSQCLLRCRLLPPPEVEIGSQPV